MFDFPNSPTSGQVVNSPNGQFKWDGTKWTPVAAAGGYLPLTGGTLSGNLNINATWPALVLNKPSSGTGTQIIGQTNGLTRWHIYNGDGTPETGSNAGSNFSIGRFNDAGANIDYPFSIKRSDGTSIFSYNVVITPAAGNDAYMFLNKPASGRSNNLIGQTAALARWNILLGDGATESGSNAGSNFSILRYADNGSYLDSPFSISRASGQINLTNQLQINSGYPAITLNKSSSGQASAMVGSLNGNNRWVVQPGNGSTETGSNVGSDFAIYRYADNGSLIDQPFGISRASGQAFFTQQVTSNGPLIGASTINCNAIGAGNSNFSLYDSVGGYRGGLNYNGSNGNIYFSFSATGASVYFDSSGNVVANPAGAGNFLVTTGHGYQAGGGSWLSLSDGRIKIVDGDYALGLDEITRLQPIVYRYKGNDALSEGGESMHSDTARRYVGLVAQDVESVMPTMVTKREGWIDGAKVDDLHELDTSELIFALVNAVKELTARVHALEAPK